MTRESIALGAASLADEEYFQEKKQMVIATRERAKEELRRREFEVLDSSTNFLFAKPNSVDAGWLFEELKKEKIFVRHFNGERIKDYLRISIGTDEQMDCLLQAIDRIMA
ncbi:MAG: aminotransferase class I/II-fold pyridoxal phosphate-dependent enzyme [Clostridium sp.]